MQSNKSIAVFGPTHSGKSTLIGYLIANAKPGFDLSAHISGIQKLRGIDYHPDRNFSSIVDTHVDEWHHDNRQGRDVLGTTLRSKTDTITIDGVGEVVIIDTPGSDTRARERVNGMYSGDIGVFVIDVKELEKTAKEKSDAADKKRTIADLLAPLFTWIKFDKPNDRTIVLFTKMDEEIAFSENEYLSARNLLQTLTGNETILPIPVAITDIKLIELTRDHNILHRSNEMRWYSGPTFIEQIKSQCSKVTASKHTRGFFIHVDRLFDPPHLGPIVHGKIFEGELRTGLTVKIAPVRYENTQYRELTAKVETLRHPKSTRDLGFVAEPDIFTSKLADIRIGGRRCTRDDFDTIGTTCIVDSTDRLLSGRILRLHLKDSVDGQHIGILRSLDILWFGKLTAAQVVFKETTQTSCILTIELNNSIAALPIAEEDDHIKFTDFFLAIDRKTFLPAKLLTIGNISHIRIPELDQGVDWSMDFFKNMNASHKDHYITIPCNPFVQNVIERIKDLYERHDLDTQGLWQRTEFVFSQPLDQVDYNIITPRQ